MSTKKSGFVPATFRDAGTEKEYEGGKSHDFEPGEYQNFKAAGLIVDKADAVDGKPAKGGTAS